MHYDSHFILNLLALVAASYKFVGVGGVVQSKMNVFVEANH